MASNSSWGIEVGAGAVKAIRLVYDGEHLTVADYEVLPFKEVLTTPEINVHEAIQVQLDQLASRHDFSKDIVVVSVPGHTAFARFAKMPPVPPKEVPNIVRYEAVQQIPFPLEQVEWDYQVFEQEDSPEVGVGIFAITKERVMEFLSDYRHVDLHIDALTLSPLAVYNAFHYDNGGDDAGTQGKVYLDIGSQATDVIIAADGTIWTRTLPIGGNNFTEALVRAFKLSFSKAEKLKREAGTSKYSRQIFQAMRPVFADLVQELQRSLGYYQSMNRDIELTELVGVGSTFRLPGLRKFLQQQLQMNIGRVDHFKRLHIDGKEEAEFTEHAMNLATAYGLALQGLEMSAVNANLLPSHIVQQRMWKQKAKWFHGAAALTAAAAVVAVGWTFSVSGGFESERQAAENDYRSVINDAKQQANDVIKLDDPKNRVENFQRLLDYRDLWPKLMLDIDEALTSVQSPEILLEPKYKELLDNPQFTGANRKARERLYIDDISVRYVPAKEVPVTPKPGGPTAREINRSFTETMTLALTPADFWAPPGELKLNPNNDQMKILPPRYEVKISGTSPYEDPATLLNRTLLATLGKHSEGKDRPYRLVVLPKIDLVFVGETGSNDNNNTNRNTGRGPTGRTRPQPEATRGRPRPMMDQPGMGMPEPGMMQQGGNADLAAALKDAPVTPVFPLADENRSKDWKFTITFEVELKSPREARGSAEANEGSQPDNAKSDEAQPAPESAPGSTPGSDAPESDAPGAPAGGPQADRQFPANLEEASS